MGLILLWFDGQTSLARLVLHFAMIAAILPYILLNLGFSDSRYKVFMGDAGSTLISHGDLDSAGDYPGTTHPNGPVTQSWPGLLPFR